MFSIMFVLVTKGLWLVFSISRFEEPLFALVWIGVSLAPQLILVSLLKLDHLYVLKTTKLLSGIDPFTR